MYSLASHFYQVGPGMLGHLGGHMKRMNPLPLL